MTIILISFVIGTMTRGFKNLANENSSNSLNLTNEIEKFKQGARYLFGPRRQPVEDVATLCTQVVSSSKQSTVIVSNSSSSMDAIPSANLRRQKLDQQRQMVSERQKQRRQQQVSYNITKVTL